jgi:hypothetical protein
MRKPYRPPKKKTPRQSTEEGSPRLADPLTKEPNKFHWRDLLTISSLILGGLSLTASGIAIHISTQANENYKKAEKLDIAPKLLLLSKFCRELECLSVLTIKNSALVDPVQVKVAHAMHIYAPEVNSKFMGALAFSHLNPRPIDKIKAGEGVDLNYGKEFVRKFIEDAKKLLVNFSDGSKFESSQVKESRIFLEIVVKYARESDLTEYGMRSFYFINPQGNLVNDRHESVQGDDYMELRKAVFERFKTKPARYELFDEVRADRDYPL